MEPTDASGAHWKREEVLANRCNTQLSLALLSTTLYRTARARAEESGQLRVNLSGKPHAQCDHTANRNRLAIICDAIIWPVWTRQKKRVLNRDSNRDYFRSGNVPNNVVE